MLTAIIIIGGVGLFVGIFLGVGGIAFHIKVDEREEAILNVLPGNNCGGCGYPGCPGLAAAIIAGEAKTNACPVGGDSVAAKIAEIMGAKVLTTDRMVAFVHCKGNAGLTKNDYDYTGAQDCKMMTYMQGGGQKTCHYGCLGFGNCVKVCPFDAIHIIDNIAKVDTNLCKACGKCVTECPKHIIDMVPAKAQTFVACSSKDKGVVAMKGCEVCCIGCGICKKNCPSDAITVENFLASIDYDKCTNCGMCVSVCPKKCIHVD